MLPDECERPLLTVDELLPHLPLGRSAIYEAMNRGEIPTVRIGSRVFIVNAELRRAWGLPTHDMRTAGRPGPAAATTDHREDVHDDQRDGTPLHAV
jgi:predicted DNA-binding transcriptional regulator AlpA